MRQYFWGGWPEQYFFFYLGWDISFNLDFKVQCYAIAEIKTKPNSTIACGGWAIMTEAEVQ